MDGNIACLLERQNAYQHLGFSSPFAETGSGWKQVFSFGDSISTVWTTVRNTFLSYTHVTQWSMTFTSHKYTCKIYTTPKVP